MKKIFLLTAVLLCALAALLFAMPRAAAPVSSRLNIVTTIFPEYDWVQQILGQNAADANVTLLLGNGVDLHSFQPSVHDIAKISGADIFIYVGGESDEWAEDVLKTARNKKLIALKLMDVLGDRAKEEEVVEGMEAEEAHDGDGDADEPEYDEHVWLSLRNAQLFCNAITDALCRKDVQHAADYRENCAAYTQKLAALDADYAAAVQSAPRGTLLFGDRFPFRYMTDDYGLQYYAAFVGCSAETEASFRTITFLSNKVNELGLQCVCQIESGNGKLARTIIQNSRNTKARILTFDSMQSVTAKDVQKGASYLGIMQKNLAVLQQALD